MLVSKKSTAISGRLHGFHDGWLAAKFDASVEPPSFRACAKQLQFVRNKHMQDAVIGSVLVCQSD